MERLSWDEYALRLAEVAALRSEDPYQKVGSCALRFDNSVASLGFNGCPPKTTIDWSDRDKRRIRVSHAENSCLRYTKPGECRLIAVTISPCPACTVQIASYGIKEIVFREVYRDYEQVLELCREFGLKISQLQKREIVIGP